MSDAKLLGEADPSVLVASGQVESQLAVEPGETRERLGSLDFVSHRQGYDLVRN